MAACQGIYQPVKIGKAGNSTRRETTEISKVQSKLHFPRIVAVAQDRLGWERKCCLKASRHKLSTWSQIRKFSTAAHALKNDDLHLIGSQKLGDGSTLFTFGEEEPQQVVDTAVAATPSARADSSQPSSLPPRPPSSFKKQSPIPKVRSLKASTSSKFVDTPPSAEDEIPSVIARPALPPRLPSKFRKRSPIQKQAQQDSSAGTPHLPNFSFKSIHMSSTGGNGYGISAVNQEVLDQVSFPSDPPAISVVATQQIAHSSSLGEGPFSAARGHQDDGAAASEAIAVNGSTSSVAVGEMRRGRRKKATHMVSSSSDDDEGSGSSSGGDGSKGRRGRRKKSEQVSSKEVETAVPVHPLPSRLTTTSFTRRNPIPARSPPRAVPGAEVQEVKERRKGRPRAAPKLKEEENRGSPVGTDGDLEKVPAHDIEELYAGTITLGKLKSLAKAFRIKGYTKLRKPELVEVLQGVIPRP